MPNARAALKRILRSPRTNIRHASSSIIPGRARNLSARYPTVNPSAFLNVTSPTLLAQQSEAHHKGLSPQGLANPKSVQAAALLDLEANTEKKVNVGGVIVELPEKPSPPGPEDCCMSGCAVCVHDLYVDALKDYRSTLNSIRDTLKAKAVDKALWPKEIVEMDGAKKGDAVDADLDEMGLDPATKAFMKMERQLQRKREAQSQS